ncbi:hypothetical protein AB0K08_16090 [Citricoccus sp. NPDC055426]|uniref:hypothetical protein n=1 Tax=Citricoccus sp. NPDC055426 TaxID=3155536 RepID=UPI00342DC8BF
MDTKQTKTIGEHWAASELARHGWAPAMTRDGLARTDILALHTQTGRMIQVQVKTSMSDGSRTSWVLGTNAQLPAIADNEWFVLAAIPKDPTQPPRGFIAPRDHVAAAAWISHMAWLTEPSVPPGQRNAGVERSRVQGEVFAGYDGRWDQLTSPTTETSILLPPAYHRLALEQRVGLPPNHPWRDDMPHPW